MKRFILAMTLLSSVAYAEKHEHRHHQAHVHGAATLNIAFEKLQGRIEFKAAADGVVGFEHQATNAKDKKILNDTISKFELNITKMIQIEPSLECVISKEKIDLVGEADAQDKKSDKQVHGQHSDFIANYNVTCKKEIIGSNIILDFTQFPKLKDLDVTLLADEIQKTAEIKGKAITIEIK